MPAQNNDPEKAILERAEKMWREDGRPAGRLPEYLERARELQAIVDNPTAGQLPNPAATLPPGAVPVEPVEEAAIQENLGEFPGRLTDQGDRLGTPLTRDRAHQVLKEE